jgi:hypothetical protein
MQTTAIELSQFPIVDTRDAEVMRETMLIRYGATKFEAFESAPFFGRSATAHLGSASLVFCAYGAPALAEFPEAENFPKRTLSDCNSPFLVARATRSRGCLLRSVPTKPASRRRPAVATTGVLRQH